MKIAFASQNRREITGHAGQCRRFWVAEVIGDTVAARQLVELPREQTFHATGAGFPPPLEGIGMLVAGSMGPGLRQRLAARNINAVVTGVTDVDAALAKILAGTLVDEPPVVAADHHGTGGHHCSCGHHH